MSIHNLGGDPVAGYAWEGGKVILERPVWVLFGDSLTERSFDLGGWGSSIQHRYYRRIDVLNRGAALMWLHMS